MTEPSERQRDQVWLLPRGSRLGAKHSLTAPVAQRRVLVEQQRKGGEELVEVNNLRSRRHGVADQPHPEPGHGVVVDRAVAVVFGEPADAGCHYFFRDAASVPADGQPCESQMIAVAELRVGKGQAEKGMQKLVVREHSVRPILAAAPARHWGRGLLRKRIDPAGSLRWLRRLPCG
jgi:hypothetical protein